MSSSSDLRSDIPVAAIAPDMAHSSVADRLSNCARCSFFALLNKGRVESRRPEWYGSVQLLSRTPADALLAWRQPGAPAICPHA